MKRTSLTSGTSASTAPSLTVWLIFGVSEKVKFEIACVGLQLKRRPVQLRRSVECRLLTAEKPSRRHSPESATVTGPAQVENGEPEMLPVTSSWLVMAV